MGSGTEPINGHKHWLVGRDELVDISIVCCVNGYEVC